MRILYLVRTLTAGGIEPHIMALGRGLMQQGGEVAIASDGGIGNHSHGVEWFEAAGFRHYKVDFPKPDNCPRACLAALKSMFDLERAMIRFHPDIIHVHYRATSCYAAVIEAVHGVPFISTLHMTGIPCKRFHRAVSLWGRRTIAISRETQQYLRESFGVRESRIRMIHNGAEETFFHPPSETQRRSARRELNIESNAKVIAMVARMSREKGHDVLLEAVAKLRQQGEHVIALLAGISINGDQKWHDEVLHRAKQLGILDNIRMLGFTDSRTVLWAADVSVLPSRQEGFPMTVVESMLCGLVTIRTPAAGAYEQITDGKDGFIVPFDDSDALSERLRLVFHNDLRSSIGSAGLAKARQHFSAGAMVEKTRNVYEEALIEKGRFWRDACSHLPASDAGQMRTPRAFQ
jgi:glycosyltransferase involved in cell wall biosynthesis